METKIVPTPVADFDALIRELQHRIWEVRRDSCEELANLGDRRAVPYLLQALGDRVGAVRYSAAEALGKLGDKSVIPHLMQKLVDPAFGSHVPVVESLANLKAPEAIPHFIALLRDPEVRLRGLVANSLMVLTRQVMPFKAKGTEEEREPVVKQWETWWRKNQATFKV